MPQPPQPAPEPKPNPLEPIEVTPIDEICVQGEREAQYVCRALGEAGIDATQPEPELGLTDPPLYAFVATSKAQVALTEEELVAILEQDEKLEVAFDRP